MENVLQFYVFQHYRWNATSPGEITIDLNCKVRKVCWLDPAKASIIIASTTPCHSVTFEIGSIRLTVSQSISSVGEKFFCKLTFFLPKPTLEMLIINPESNFNAVTIGQLADGYKNDTPTCCLGEKTVLSAVVRSYTTGRCFFFWSSYLIFS